MTRRRPPTSETPHWSDLPDDLRQKLPTLFLANLGENETKVLAALIRQDRPTVDSKIAAAAGVARGTQVKAALYRLRDKELARMDVHVSLVGIRRFWSVPPDAMDPLIKQLEPQIDALVELVAHTASRLSEAHWRRDWRATAVAGRDLFIYSVALERALDFIPTARIVRARRG